MKTIHIDQSTDSKDAGDGSEQRPYNCALVKFDEVFTLHGGNCRYRIGPGRYQTHGVRLPPMVEIVGGGSSETTIALAPDAVLLAGESHVYAFRQQPALEVLNRSRFSGFTIELGAVGQTGRMPTGGIIAFGDGLAVDDVIVRGARGNFAGGIESFVIMLSSRAYGQNDYRGEARLPNSVTNSKVLEVLADLNQQPAQPYYDRPYAYTTAILVDNAPGTLGTVSGCTVSGDASAMPHAAYTASNATIRDCVASSVRAFLHQDTYDVGNIRINGCLARDVIAFAHIEQTGNYRATDIWIENNSVVFHRMPTKTTPNSLAYLAGTDRIVLANNFIVMTGQSRNPAGIVLMPPDRNRLLRMEGNVIVSETADGLVAASAPPCRDSICRQNYHQVAGRLTRAFPDSPEA